MKAKVLEPTSKPGLKKVEEELPTTSEVISAIEDSFEEDVRPIWAEWNKDVRFATYRSAYISATGK